MTMAALLFSFAFHVISVHEFNEKEHIAGTLEGGAEEENVVVSIHPRGNSGDSWKKDFNRTDGVSKASGLIYEADLRNYSVYDVVDWKLQVNIHTKCYLNNGWNGTFEVHQQFNGKEVVQTLDFKNPGYVSLNHYFVDQELVIPLEEGDYFVYIPTEDERKSSVAPGASNEEGYTSTCVGFIIYVASADALDFSDANVKFRQIKTIIDGSEAKMYLLLFGIWFCCMAIYVSLAIYRRIAASRMEQSNTLINNAMSVFTGFFEAKDSYTRGHSGRVAEYATNLARACGLSETELRTVYHIAYMHDCGKSYISDQILKKEGKLTDEEFEIMKSHTVKGAEMVQDFTAVEGLQDGVRHHHERYDGKGYPDGLAGEEIPWIARVICIADSYDAMSSDRCYRKKLEFDEILAEFERCKGKQFDPELTDIFVELIKK